MAIAPRMNGVQVPMRRAFLIALFLGLCGYVPSVRAACAPPPSIASKLKARPDASTYTELGQWLSDHQQYTCAAKAYREGLALRPQSAELNYLLGVSLYAGGFPKDAIAPLRKSILLRPHVIKPHLVLAGALEQVQDFKQARSEWESALAVDPHSAIALDGLSKNLLAEGDYISVIRLLGPAPRDQALDIDLAMAYQKGDMSDQAEDILRKDLRASPASEEITHALVTILALQAHFEEAVVLAKKCMDLHPNELGPQKLYLHVLVLNDDTAEAQPLAAKLLKMAPHDFEVLYLAGVLERESGKYQIARTHLEEAVSLNPDYYNSRYNLGVALAQLDDLKGAREQFEKALALGAFEPQIRFEYAKVLNRLGETKLAQEQLQLYQKEQQAQANRTLAASKSAQAEKELAGGHVKQAIALYQDAVAALPTNAMLELKLALALDRAGDTVGELAALKKAVQLDPRMAIAHKQIGYLASRQGDTATAEEEFRAAVRAAPAYVDAWISLAATLGMESRFAEAQKALSTALQLDPQNASARQLRKDLATAAAQASQ